ncbi:hypothetical protein ACOMHN_059518 [Nucella lapillus]
MSQEKPEEQRVFKSTDNGKTPLSFVIKGFRTFTGKRSSSQRSRTTSFAENTVTSPTPSPLPPPPSSSARKPPSSSLLPERSIRAREAWTDQPSPPRVVRRSHSLSHLTGCCGCSQNRKPSSATTRRTDPILSPEPGATQSTFERRQFRPSHFSHVLKTEDVRKSSSSSSRMPKRASSGSSDQKGGVTFSKRSLSREKVSGGSKSFPISDEGIDPRSGAAKAESSPTRGDEAANAGVKERERDRSASRETTGRTRTKYVCGVAPSDSKMLRRAHSEKVKAAANMTASKHAPLSRHSSISAR